MDFEELEISLLSEYAAAAGRFLGAHGFRIIGSFCGPEEDSFVVALDGETLVFSRIVAGGGKREAGPGVVSRYERAACGWLAGREMAECKVRFDLTSVSIVGATALVCHEIDIVNS